MSNKSDNKKRNRIPYAEGRNVFGEKAKTKLIVLKRETAYEQVLEAFHQFDRSNRPIEFTFDTHCFAGHEGEFNRILNKALKNM